MIPVVAQTRRCIIVVFDDFLAHYWALRVALRLFGRRENHASGPQRLVLGDAFDPAVSSAAASAPAGGGAGASGREPQLDPEFGLLTSRPEPHAHAGPTAPSAFHAVLGPLERCHEALRRESGRAMGRCATAAEDSALAAEDLGSLYSG